MKRILCLFVFALLLMTLAGCGGKKEEEPETEEQAPMVSMYDLRVAMLEADKDMPEMLSVSSSDEKAGELFAYLSEYDYEGVEGYFLAYAADGMAYEVAVVCLKDEANAADLAKTIKAHVQGRINLYKSYAPEQVPKAEAAKIVTNGRYVALIMCDDPAAVQKAFEEGIKTE